MTGSIQLWTVRHRLAESVGGPVLFCLTVITYGEKSRWIVLKKTLTTRDVGCDASLATCVHDDLRRNTARIIYNDQCRPERGLVGGRSIALSGSDHRNQRKSFNVAQKGSFNVK
ncbi:hypothetical protein EVAR_103984_1 [Eumeta japonica]|uniref:Uncharacterized protein n=1 Tax=Eumeta variegata TaxID=151549 RepID=A0A4C1XZ95_EUMVA|nr:hypothetical protein EVAR_103984_1 [Eumeta japonica]